MGIVFAALAAPGSAAAQQAGKVYRIGYVSNRLAIAEREIALRDGLRKLGYVEGRNLIIEWRFTKGDRHLLDVYAAELARLKVDCIVSSGTGTTRAMKKATSTIPIVMANIGDPVRSRLVTNLARPGGNITGFTTMNVNLGAKQLEVFKEAFPHISRLSIIIEPANPAAKIFARDSAAVGRTLGIGIRVWEMRSPADIEAPFLAAAKGEADALFIYASALLFNNRARIFALEARTRLPVMYSVQRLVPEGGLMAYGPNRVEPYRRAAVYVDKILKGTPPGDLPVEAPTRFELVINLKTARAAGINFPRSILLRADQLIE